MKKWEKVKTLSSVISASPSLFRSFWIWLMKGALRSDRRWELSYLQKGEQSALLEQIAYADATPSLAQAIKLKRFSQDGKLNNEVIESIMSEEKPNQREKINIKYAEARRFIPASVSYEKTGEYILKRWNIITGIRNGRKVGMMQDRFFAKGQSTLLTLRQRRSPLTLPPSFTGNTSSKEEELYRRHN